jgi:glycerol-3-phosphate acyltransferase PlsY
MGLILLTAWGSLPNFAVLEDGVPVWEALDGFVPVLAGFVAELIPALAFFPAFATLELAGLADLCAAFTTGLLAFFASFGACLGAPFEACFCFCFAFVLLAIVHSAQIERLATYNDCPI